jgi:lysozyme family protein
MPDSSPVSRFETCLAIVLGFEGGFTDDPRDPGGATNFGVTRRTLAGWRGITPWQNLPVAEVRALGQPEATRIYRALYWDRCNADELPTGLDLAVFDFAVNSGPARAITMLQQEVGAVPDGLIGPKTLNAIKERIALTGVAGIIVALCNGRLGFLQRLAITATFGRGWSRRVDQIRMLALAAARASASSPSQPQKGTSAMNLGFLAGYKTYIVGAAMLVAGIAQLAGVAIPALGGQSAGDLLMQGLAVIFLRQGITNTVSAAVSSTATKAG